MHLIALIFSRFDIFLFFLILKTPVFTGISILGHIFFGWLKNLKNPSSIEKGLGNFSSV